MSTAIQEVVLTGLLVWFVGALLLRLVAISCLIVTAGLLAMGTDSLAAPARLAAYGLACWAGSELLHRARRGYWRSRLAAGVVARCPRPQRRVRARRAHVSR
jgi:hypothetical protein